ncbi:ABC-2 integral membrane protein [Thermoplasma volcanium GSS1]|uniref:ABC-2 integral membrane protein n=1 Tax=Thermoplasma volcanium (strain ATCC 51530 / DSM 4299 / JCM 9571 / NBRC 15438 / GSS1) TaxID=273116 RepID=Q979U1_THEVO|nr:ABC transporter permease [Thermoplasma volcanium]BAB60211.1 ABC-2 integral membrane protein [Thermoplasma volcanium GSS1]
MHTYRSSQLAASILVNAIYAMKNFPITLINTLLSPLSFLLVITLASHGRLISVSVGGALIMSMVSSGLGLQGDLSHLKNDFKLQDIVVSSPTTASVYLVGMAISEIVYSIPAISVLGILAYFFIHTSAIGVLTIIGVLVVMFSFSILLGFTLATITYDIIQSWAFSGIVSTLISTIPPVYYPITYIPMPFRYAAYASPTTYAAEIIQNSIGMISLSSTQIAEDWIIIVIVTILLLIIAVKKAKWREI